MHDKIRPFQMHGTMTDSSVHTTRERMIGFMEMYMRDSGYAPSLDLNPQFTLHYREDESFDFTLTVYGVLVGMEEAWQTSGVASGKRIPRDK